MPHHIRTVIKTVHRITGAQDTAAGLQLAASGTIPPIAAPLTKTTVNRVRSKTTKTRWELRVTTFEIAVHTVSDTDAHDQSSALAAKAAGKAIQIEARTSSIAARVKALPARS
jgi:hypothetical protein